VGVKTFKEYTRSVNFFDNFINSDEGKSIYTDKNYEEGELLNIIFYDSFSNEGIRKLIDKLHKLDSNNYELKHINTHKAVKRKQFIVLQETFSSVGIFADVTVKNDKYIDSIHISWCQRSNYTAMVEFKISFKQIFSSFQDEYEFVHEKLKLTKSSFLEYYPVYNPDMFIYQGTSKIYEYIKLHNSFLHFAFQTYLTEVLYTENGKINQLFSLEIYKVSKKVLKKCEAPYMGIIGRNRFNDSVFIMDFLPSFAYQELLVKILTSDNKFDTRNLLSLFSKYRNLIYYNIYFYYEINKLNQKISPYNIGVKKNYTFDELRWMYKKIAELKSSRDNCDIRLETELNNLILDEWDISYGTYEEDKKIEEQFKELFLKSNVDFVLKTYKEQYELYQIAIETQNIERNNKIAFTSLVLAIVAIIISIVFSVI